MEEPLVCEASDEKAEKEFERILIWDAIRRNLNSESTYEYEILRYYYLLDMTDGEIAKKLNSTAEAIKKRRRRVLKRIDWLLKGTW